MNCLSSGSAVCPCRPLGGGSPRRSGDVPACDACRHSGYVLGFAVPPPAAPPGDTPISAACAQVALRYLSDRFHREFRSQHRGRLPAECLGASRGIRRGLLRGKPSVAAACGPIAEHHGAAYLTVSMQLEPGRYTLRASRRRAPVSGGEGRWINQIGHPRNVVWMAPGTAAGFADPDPQPDQRHRGGADLPTRTHRLGDQASTAADVTAFRSSETCLRAKW